jgi:carboxyl-terminal processing protease
MYQHADTYIRCLLLGFLFIFSSNALAQDEGEDRIPLEDVQRFSNAITQIKHYYVKPTKNKKIFDQAIQGMLQGLDPHSAYLDEDAYKELQSSTHGEFGGLGIEVTMEKGLIKVVSPLDDTPASKAGIKSGDYIVRLGNTPIIGLSLKEAVKKMRGKVGEPITLIILRKGVKKPIKLTVVRENIQVKSVKSRLIDKKFAYIRVSQFQSMTAKSMIKAINTLKKEAGGKLSGLILDLRNNPGGLLDSAIEISDAFIDNDKKGKDELIVFTKGRSPGSKFIATASPGDIIGGAPIVVLINGGSASGSEIVAGALKDNKRALLLGTKSFGKGSVQTVLPLDDKTGIKLTTAFYYTPSGESIQAKGISPDIIVEEVNIPKKESDDTPKIKGLSEADLKGHLVTKKGKDGKIIKSVKKKDSDLIHKDYQLHEALNILKGISLARK